ncbi:serine hydrolase domain-containing protein [Flammeovirga aprica]|uniref:Beta-lactamase family protein n=1 Tax=Flammeovirga aprica JL-4 TaxID=694437 RepID=A0A7X9RTD5_9BACT|nr:serine hydrolase domain-containing protein [Flammeovirga aprica]NME67174.1 beta-lactamase family protein [Flammeovirga aprica JL-4]
MKKLLLSSLLAGATLLQVNAQDVKDQNAENKMTPIKEVVSGFPKDYAEHAISTSFNTWLQGGDESLYFQMKTSEFLPTSIIPRRIPTMELEKNIRPEIGAIEAETIFSGKKTLDEFLADPEFRAQGYMVIHKGKIVYESYPGMRPSDSHAWMSCAKPTAALLVELLINEGKIDDSLPISHYVKEFQGTAWENVTVKQIMHMDSGLDIDDTAETRPQPDAHAHRLYLSEFGQPYNGKVEKLIDVLASAQPGEGAGKKFVYASAHTEALVFLVEAVTGERWSETFDKKVWSKMGVEGPMQVQTTPDGVALSHGVIGTRMSDMARFGMLYTPSWDKVAEEQIVTDETLTRIHEDMRSHEFLMAGEDGPVFSDWLENNNPTFLGNSRQWDVLWPDGDMWKGGMQTQGLYVSPSKDLVIVYMSTAVQDHSLHRFVRKVANSGLFE